MIRSSVFTFDESSIWDPKLIREYLNIPEDQLNTLRNLPEWSEETDNNTFRIEKDSICENTKCTVDTTLERNRDINKQNIALFDENFELRRKILNTCRLNATKLSRSISLFEIDKIGKISSSSSPLKSSSSVPDLYLFSESLCSKYLHSEFRNKDSPPERHSSTPVKSINLSVTKQGGKTYIAVQANSGISKRRETYIEKSKMEVDSQLPVAIPCYVDEIRNNETDTEILVENNTVLTSLTLKSPNKLNLSPNNESISSVTNANKFGNSCSVIEIKATKLSKPDSPNLCDKNETDIVKKPITSNNCNPDVSKNTKLAEQDGPVSCEKDELDVVTVEGTDLAEVNIAIENKRIETNMDFHESAKANETSDQCSGSLIVSKEVCAAKVNKVSSDNPENQISDSDYLQMEVQNGQQTVHQNISDNKLDFAQTLSIKRKLEPKNRSSKRRKNTREKQGLEERSLKKAGEICYTAEHIKTMLNLMKQFS